MDVTACIVNADSHFIVRCCPTENHIESLQWTNDIGSRNIFTA